MKKNIPIAFFALWMTPLFSYAQGLGTIGGTVTDPSRGAVVSAKVTATEIGTGFVREAKTDERGYFVIPSLRPAEYTVSVEATGFNVTKAGSYFAGGPGAHGQCPIETGHVHGDGQRHGW